MQSRAAIIRLRPQWKEFLAEIIRGRMKAWSLGDRDFFFSPVLVTSRKPVVCPFQNLETERPDYKTMSHILWLQGDPRRKRNTTKGQLSSESEWLEKGKEGGGETRSGEGIDTCCAFTQASDFVETLCPSAKASDHIKTLTTQYLKITLWAALSSVSPCVVFCFEVDSPNGHSWPRVGNPFVTTSQFQGFMSHDCVSLSLSFSFLPLTRTASALPFFIVPLPINFILFLTCQYNINHQPYTLIFFPFLPITNIIYKTQYHLLEPNG